jgi:hypothetical protein
MRTALKRAAISMYCHGALPAACVAWLFRAFDLRGE